MPNITRQRKLSENNRAISPAISTVILTSCIVVLLIITLAFANSYLNKQVAANEFEGMQQSMQSVGLQVDNVAWTIGQTQTIKYASNYGTVNFKNMALNYSMYVDFGSGYGNTPVAKYSVGIILFNMPTFSYSLGNSYFKNVFPTSKTNNFLQNGTAAPICHVFIVEKLPMSDGNFIRIAVAPSVRMINSTMTSGGVNTDYFRFYLGILTAGPAPRYSQSVTLVGNSTSVLTEQNIRGVKIVMSFPIASQGFDNSFFNFESLNQTIAMPSGSVAQVYTGNVVVSLGVYV